MDWGKGITMTLAAFAVLMLSMVAICVKQDDIHLVTQNYYEEEIKYQDQIDKMINTSQLNYEVLAYDNQLKIIDLQLPTGAKGTLHLFRPSDARLDKKIDFDIIDPNVNSVDVKNLKPGYWRVKLSWTENGISYYQEKKINI
ncbi:FixH family protein [Cecembia lonarensis]|uniref:FixH n=1 Tax=Cecembia lonarensis (strain CCUG 58316 / KCTC 22772 / LW9) TaxID=1225176 RepID=K1LYV8_CECL9|nr:FixH family protein [Cecembia lonarensis]EKB49254.1 FixH [Cecembia lonarensis LW9]